MKRKYIFLIISTAIILSVIVNFIQSALPWTLPQSIVGDWTSKQKVTVRFHDNGKYDFKKTPDSVTVKLAIQKNGIVIGNIGTAVFEDCFVDKNQGWIKKFINFSTDYAINGKIKGNIFPDDTIYIKGIRFPLYIITDSSIDATIFQSNGMDIFPMAYLHLKKKQNLHQRN
jgi:hypothetical protein